MSALLWVAGLVLVAVFLAQTAFFNVFATRCLLQSGVPLPWPIKIEAYFWLAVGYPADIIFNWTYGSFVFREWPREWLFSDRIRRHVLSSDRRSRRIALRWARLLNAIDPDHNHVVMT